LGVIYLLWNWALVSIFPAIPKITFLQAVGVALIFNLVKSLFRSK
jgi:hypothetical protein